MFRLRFYLDKRLPSEQRAFDEVNAYQASYRASTVRHSLLAASLLYGDYMPEQILALSEMDVVSHEQDLAKSRATNFLLLELRWPKNKFDDDSLAKICQKADLLKPAARSAYLNTLFMIGRDILKGKTSIASPKSVKGHSQANNEKPEKPVVVEPTKTEKINKTSPNVSPKLALGNLMKRPVK